MATTNLSNGTASKDYQELSEQITTLKGDIAGIAELLGEIGVRRKDESIEAARQRAEELRVRGAEHLSQAQQHAAVAQDQAIDAIRRQPGTAVGLAVGIGFLAGFLTGRK
ncbi:YqjD family protein [Puniceibacterium sp. IMCC21224]|uniref:DUF883 family protein n=1 Tax=Puniceibacterium sp. IMCC21224 TaxID=1618204 RepID=UPI00064D8D6B|nr:DUF883 family protein [Puniceibacterium sp. IMCC21224]KMK66110.1 hypothetical protein IMCC21224_11957 [Puniceibacterium sp. IMCC21224]